MCYFFLAAPPAAGFFEFNAAAASAAAVSGQPSKHITKNVDKSQKEKNKVLVFDEKFQKFIYLYIYTCGDFQG